MSKLSIIDAGEVSPELETGIIRYFIKKVAADQENVSAFLSVASPTRIGISLGQFQVAPITLQLGTCREEGFSIYHRLTGGASTFYGKGIVNLSLILSTPSAFSDPIPPAKVINRYIRGILTGLQRFGLNAMYYGGDFLAVNKKRAGYLSMNMDPQGIVLFQTVLAMSQNYTIPKKILNYPARVQEMRPPPEPTHLHQELGRCLTRQELNDSLLKGYEKRFGIKGEVRPLSKEELGEASQLKMAETLHPSLDQTPALEGLVGSDLYEFSGGFFQAWVSLDKNRCLDQVRLTGDLVVDSPALGQLQNRLKGVPLIWEEIGKVVDQILMDSAHFIFGFKTLKVIPDSILDAAKRFKNPEIDKNSMWPYKP